MGSTVSMVKRTYVIGRSNRNAPNLYRIYNCDDHLFPYETTKLPESMRSIRLATVLEAFNSLVSQNLKIEHKKYLQEDELELYKTLIKPEKILYKMLSSSPEARDVRLEVSSDEKQVYLCRNYITELNEQIGELAGIYVFQTCCNYMRYLPYSIGHLRNLKMLIVSRNRLVELPDEIAMCKELREIDVSYNLLRALPRSIAGLKRLNTLHLTGNRFEKLPSFMGKLTSLKYINISYNPLQYIPLEVFKLPFLLSLTADSCEFQFKSSFKEIGLPTLMETTARNIIRNNLRVSKNMAVSIRNYLLKAQECSFCGGPFFDNYIEVFDQHTFEGEEFPVSYRTCCRHYNSHAERLLILFEKNLSTYPAKLFQDGMPSITELFEPLCLDEVQSRRMSEGFQAEGDTMPLISMAMYNSTAYRKFRIEKIFEDNIENLNVFDDILG